MEDTVRKFLVQYPQLRDSYKKLATQIWYVELRQLGCVPSQISATDFFSLYTSGKLSNEETIQRARRKLQESEPMLRGVNYGDRKREEKEVREQINTQDDSKFHQLNLF